MEEGEYWKDPPPPYSLREEPPNRISSSRQWLTNIKEAFRENPLYEDSHKDSNIPKPDHYLQFIYNHVSSHPADFHYQKEAYENMFPNLDEVDLIFHQYPPRCKSYCCTDKLVTEKYGSKGIAYQVYMKFSLYLALPEWFHDCSEYPEPKRSMEIQGDIRFSKSYENLLSRNYGWNSASAWHKPYVADFGPRRIIFNYALIAVLILTVGLISAAVFLRGGSIGEDTNVEQSNLKP